MPATRTDPRTRFWLRCGPKSKRVFATAPQQYGFRPSALWGVEKAQFLKVLESTVTALVADSDWTPIAFEQWFGKHGSPPLIVEVGREVIQIHGVIDRVDRNTEGDLRVMDYKTGSAHHTADDLRRGYSLQLPLYALAAEQTLNLGHAVDGLYWQINAGKAGSLKLAKLKSGELTGIGAAYEVLYQHLERIVHGIHAAQFPPVRPKAVARSIVQRRSGAGAMKPGGSHERHEMGTCIGAFHLDSAAARGCPGTWL